MTLIKDDSNFFILGKPGAGKTTFLKYLTVQAAQRNLSRLPIFISLNEWANSRYGKGNNPQLMPFIIHQFEICHFDDAATFVEALLRSGQAMVLFDGLDEVRQEDEQRRQLTQLLKDFARQYDRSQHLITCRIAANDYAFPGFRDVEVADFSDEQIDTYAKLWFHSAGKSHETFLIGLAKEENAGVRELCNSPLLLSMVCLYFERVMRFPPNRAELYDDAIEALLNKWDASRSILRDEIPDRVAIYRELSARRKEQLFAEIAARTFEKGDYFFRRRDLVKWIGKYLIMLPNVSANNDIDSNVILRAIEAQHGIFVERAKDIYSFSHLTFQEYFTARYIFDHVHLGTTTNLLKNHLTDNRWREIFLLTVSLFDSLSADNFFKGMRDVISEKTADTTLHKLVICAGTCATVANPLGEQWHAVHLAYIFLLLARATLLSSSRFLESLLPRARSLGILLSLSRSLDSAFSFASKLASTLSLVRARNFTNALDIAFTSKLESTLERMLSLDLAYQIASDLARDLSFQVGFDYGLYYAWAYATLFAQVNLSHTSHAVSNGKTAYPTLIDGITRLAQQAHVENVMTKLTRPSVTANFAAWQQFADKLYAIMQARGLVHDWQFTEEQLNQLNDYFYANELLVQCLNVAVVSDRQAILSGLLAPPQGDKEI